jgi:hypothetical protein
MTGFSYEGEEGFVFFFTRSLTYDEDVSVFRPRGRDLTTGRELVLARE